MGAFSNDYKWQLGYLEPIKHIVGPLLLVPAEFERDAKEATDMLVLTARDMRIGCRIRRAGYADKYPWDFTIRSRRDSGAKTELAKITEGWGDWLFYGHAEHNEIPTLARWFVIDLAAWRAQMIRARELGSPRHIPNGDGTYFVAFDIRKFAEHPVVCIASSHEIPRLAA